MSVFSQSRVALSHKCFWLRDDLFARWLAAHLAPFGRTICDVGAGDGFMLPYLLEAFSKVIAVEPSPAAVRLLRGKSDTKRVRVLQSSAESIPLPSRTVAIALAKSSFHHFRSLEEGLREMRRISKNAVAVAEVIAPSRAALKFARTVLLEKEPTRPSLAVFSELDLRGFVAEIAGDVKSLHFDQYIDVEKWLATDEITERSRKQLYGYIAKLEGNVKADMHIHFQRGRLLMLRRMALVIGVIS